MDSPTRLLTALSFKQPDRIPIELEISPESRKLPEAERINEFIDNQADNFAWVDVADWGFLGLCGTYSEEVLEDIPDQYRRIKHTWKTSAGEFIAITKHNADEIEDSDFRWEKRYIDTIDDMRRLAHADRSSLPILRERQREMIAQLNGRRVPKGGLMHPLGWLVRNANMEEVYGWLMTEPQVVHAYLEHATRQVADAVQSACDKDMTRMFTIVAHEMLIPPWMGMRMFDEFVYPYDKTVNDTIHRNGGKLRSHCHGNCMEYLEKMSDMGVDAIEPLEPPPLGDIDLAEAKRRVGDRMMLSGNVPSQDFLRISADEVRRRVRYSITAAAKGGGFSLRTTGGNAGTGSVKDRKQLLPILRNIEVYIDAALEFGQY